MTDEPVDALAQFVDRYTMRYERRYPHPVERVWEALTTAEHLDAWMMPANAVDARPEGRFTFGFGGAVESGLHGTIAAFEPPAVVDYAFDNGSSMRFELQAFEGGTRLAFIHSFPIGQRGEPMPGDPGGDLPGGGDTPWRPGFVAGFHQCLVDLGTYLAGEGPTLDEKVSGLDRHQAGEHDPEWLRLIEVYRRHIVDTIPPR